MFGAQQAVTIVVDLRLKILGGVEHFFLGERPADGPAEVDEAVNPEPPDQEAGVLDTIEAFLAGLGGIVAGCPHRRED